MNVKSAAFFRTLLAKMSAVFKNYIITIKNGVKVADNSYFLQEQNMTDTQIDTQIDKQIDTNRMLYMNRMRQIRTKIAKVNKHNQPKIERKIISN